MQILQSLKETGYLTIKKSSLYAFLSFILFKITLDFSYCMVVSQVWIYDKFEFNPNNFKIAESYLLLVFIYIFMPKSTNKISHILIWLLIFMSYLPMLTIYAFGNESRLFIYIATAFWLIVFFLIRLDAPKIFMRRIKNSEAILYLIFIALELMSFLIIYVNLPVTINFDLIKAYDIRAAFTDKMIPVAGYIFNWTAYVVNPVALALFVRERKWYFAVLILLMQILLFSAVGFRTYLFILPFVLVLMWIVNSRNPIALLGIVLTGLIAMGMLSYYFAADRWISAIVSNRVFLGPAQLAFYYYDFFSQHEPVYLAHSIFRFFIDYPYQSPPPYLIAELYYNSPEMEANTGMVSDAFMNFGFIGVILFSVFFAIILKFIDLCSNKVALSLAVAAIAIQAVALTNGGLLTSLLTNGLILGLLTLYLLPTKKNQARISNEN